MLQYVEDISSTLKTQRVICQAYGNNTSTQHLSDSAVHITMKQVGPEIDGVANTAFLSL